MSNNFLTNFENVQRCLSSASEKHQQQQPARPSMNLFGFTDELSGSNAASTCDIFQQQQIFAHSPTSQSLNLNLINQIHNESGACKNATGGQIVFSKNNPFLNDTFDAITAHEDEGGGGKIDASFFNVDDSNESELLFLTEKAPGEACTEIEENSLKNKREKFSNASTMKICLVVSPPTNKMFQVSKRFVDVVSRRLFK
jgi:hypothetical protein